MGRSSAGAIGFAEFTTIVLLCGEGERKPLGAALKRHNPRLRLVKAVTAADLDVLLRRVAHRDAEAFAALYDATRSRVYGMVARVLRDRG